MLARDIRISGFRHAVVYWRERGTITHLPTGQSVEYEISWNDRSGLRLARDQLRQLVDQAA